MPNELCNLSDRRELEHLRELKKKGIDGKRMLRDVGGYDAATGRLRSGNIRIDKFQIEPEAKAVMQDLIEEGHYFVEQRRGTMNFEATGELARELRPKLKLRAGEVLNAEEMQSLSEAVGGLSIRAAEAARIAAADPTELNLAKALAARQELNTALASLSGAKTEAGRSLSIQRKLLEGIQSRDAKLIREALRLGKDKYSVEQITAAISKIGPEDVYGQYRFLDSLRQPKVGNYLMELWYNAILSGPLTHVRNLVGNTSHALFEMATQPFSAVYDYMRSVRTGEPRALYLSETPSSLQAAFRAIPDGVRKGIEILRRGFTMDDATKLELRRPQAFKGLFGTAVNMPSRFLAASDTIARSMFMEYELNGRAYVIAKNEGLTGMRFRNRVAELRANPTPEMLEAASSWAARNVFQQRGGKFLTGMSKIRSAIDVKGIQPVAFIVPFVETPANIFKVGFRASPLGFFGKAAEPRAAAQDFGRALLGSLTMTALAAYAAAGNISGSGPSDKDQRDALYRLGWQPNSIRIGGTWYSYKNISPLNISLQLVGNALDGMIYDGLTPDTQWLTGMLVGNAKSMFDQSFLSGINGLVSAITGEPADQAKFINRFATSLIPQAIQQTIRFADPTLYETTTLSDSFKAALGVTEGLPIKYDVFGRPIERQRASGLPYPGSKENITPLEQKLTALGVQFLSPPPSRIGDRKMTPEEYANFSREVGLKLAERLGDDGELPRDLSPLKAQDRVDEIRADVYKDVRKTMFPDVPGSAAPTYDDESLQNPNGILDTVVLYVKAIGTDPVTAFERIFSGQRIRRIDHNTIIVNRMSLQSSERVKKALGATEDMRLDHTIPLELGGSNGRSNLKLVPESVWESYTPVENHLGKLLQEGKIDKRKAQKLITDFKQGLIQDDEILKLR